MQFALIMQELRRRRLVVGICFIVSLAIGGIVAYQISPGLPPHIKSRQKLVGQASTRLLVDTPSSIVADLNPAGAASLLVHAQLLGDLIATDPLRNAIAQQAGISLNDIAIVPPTIAAPVGTQVSRAVAPPAASSTITVTVDPALPIVSVDVQSPTKELAVKLANTAFAVIRGYEQSVAFEQGIPQGHQPVLKSLGVTSSVTTRGPSRIMALGVTFLLFALSCYFTLMVTGIRRRKETTAATRARRRRSITSSSTTRQGLGWAEHAPTPDQHAPAPDEHAPLPVTASEELPGEGLPPSAPTPEPRAAAPGGSRWIALIAQVERAATDRYDRPTGEARADNAAVASSNGPVPEVEHG
jgi:hypothetical protein